MTGMRSRPLRHRVSASVPKPLHHVVSIDAASSTRRLARRRVIVALTSLAGTSLLRRSLSTKPGSEDFYLSTGAAAAVWTLGGLGSGPVRRGWLETRAATLRRPLITPVATGVGAFGLFYGAAFVARKIPMLDRALSRILQFADGGDDRLVLATTLANGVGEEIFFRGALYAALGEHRPVLVTTAVYTCATATTRNPALVAAAAVMGTLFGWQRRASGGIQAPLLTHVTWSTLMLRYLPPLFASRPDDALTASAPPVGEPASRPTPAG